MTDETMQRISRRLSIIPDVFVSMQKLPLTPTGKIDRKEVREIGRSLLLSEGNVFDGTSDPSYNGDDSQGNLILQNDHPAYAIAQKVYSMRPSWMKNGDPSLQTGYKDISLHSSGLDSVNMMELTSFVSRRLNIQVDM